jgi:hypothetical protein
MVATEYVLVNSNSIQLLYIGSATVTRTATTAPSRCTLCARQLQQPLNKNKMKTFLAILTFIPILSFGQSKPQSEDLRSQDPVKLSPQFYKILLENDKVRVLEYRLKPGQTEPMHWHPPGIVYFFDNVKLKITSPDGKATESVHTQGETYWRDSVTHALENIGETEGHIIIVEQKCVCK